MMNHYGKSDDSSGISKAATHCGLLHCVSDPLVKILLSKQGKISVIQDFCFFEGCGCANVANLDRIFNFQLKITA